MDTSEQCVKSASGLQLYETNEAATGVVLVSLLLNAKRIHIYCSGVSIVDLGQVNADWVLSKIIVLSLS